MTQTRALIETLTPPLPALQFPLNGFPNEVRPVLTLTQNGLDTVESPLGEPSLHVLGPSFCASHRLFLI